MSRGRHKNILLERVAEKFSLFSPLLFFIFSYTMKKILINIFLLLVLFSSCKKKPQVSVVQSFEFKTELIDLHFRFIGLYQQDGSEYLYFVDNNKDIKIFDFQGNQFDSIPLRKIIYDFATKGDKIGGEVQFFGKDSIFIGSSHKNHISIINHKGDILQTVCIDSILPDSIKNLNEYYFSYLPNANDFSSDLLFYVRSNDKSTMDKGIQPLTLEYYEDCYTTLYNTPYLLKVKDIFSDKPEYDFLIKDYYKQISPVPYNIDVNAHKVINNDIFILCEEKPLIFRYSGKDYENLQIIEIKSDFTKIIEYIPSIKDIFGDFTTTRKGDEKYQNIKRLRGYIHNIFYNKNKYYVLVGHELKTIEEFNQYQYDYRPFSVIVFDKNFKKLKEYPFAADIYKYRNAVMTSKGLIIQKKEQNLTPDNYGTQTFDLLEFN
jgi:hypothetical protein